MKRILITGGAGFIGYHLAKHLSDNHDNYIEIIDNLSKNNYDKEFIELINKKNINFIKGDLTDKKTFKKIDTDIDQIYHLAAIVGVKKVMENPVETIRVNTLSTIYLLDHILSMKKRPKLLFTSSCENYAGTISSFGYKIPTPENVPLCVEDVTNPRWTYAVSKMLGEIACINYSKENNFESVIIRYHNVYGPRMGYNHVIPEFIQRLKKNSKEFDLFGGYQSRSFCYVTDAIKMTYNLMENNKTSGLVFNIGSDNNVFEINEIAKILFKIMKINPSMTEKGHPMGSVEKRIPDLALIKKYNCYHGEIDIEEGLRRSFEWYNNHLDGEMK